VRRSTRNPSNSKKTQLISVAILAQAILAQGAQGHVICCLRRCDRRAPACWVCVEHTPEARRLARPGWRAAEPSGALRAATLASSQQLAAASAVRARAERVSGAGALAWHIAAAATRGARLGRGLRGSCWGSRQQLPRGATAGSPARSRLVAWWRAGQRPGLCGYSDACGNLGVGGGSRRQGRAVQVRLRAPASRALQAIASCCTACRAGLQRLAVVGVSAWWWRLAAAITAVTWWS